MKISKKGNINITGLVTSIVGVVIVFYLVAGLLPSAQEAGTAIQTADLPLSNLFAPDGVVFILIMAGVLIGIVYAFMPKKHK